MPTEDKIAIFKPPQPVCTIKPHPHFQIENKPWARKAESQNSLGKLCSDSWISKLGGFEAQDRSVHSGQVIEKKKYNFCISRFVVQETYIPKFVWK